MRCTSLLHPLLAFTLGIACTGAQASDAPGVNLRWDQCYGEGGVIAKTFACDTNVGSSVLATSFVLPVATPYPPNVAIVLDLASAGPALPEWWRFADAGACRPTALTISSLWGDACPNWAQGFANLSLSYQVGLQAPNTARILVSGIQTVIVTSGLSEFFEHGLIQLNLSNARTLGTGSCGGCLTPVCIVLNSVMMDVDFDGATDDILLTGPTNGTDSHYVTWQGGAGVNVPGRPTGCPAATPTSKSTWSQVKSLYR